MTSTLKRWQAVIGAIALSVVLGGLSIAEGASVSKTVFAFGVCIVAIAAIGALQGRSEAAAVLAGNPADERQRMIHLRAIEIAGEVTIAVSLGGYVAVELMGGDSTSFAVVAACFGFAYIGAVLWLRSRL